MSQRGDYLVSESDIATGIARIRAFRDVRIVSYAVDASTVTFLLENGQQFRIGDIQELNPRENR